MLLCIPLAIIFPPTLATCSSLTSPTAAGRDLQLDMQTMSSELSGGGAGIDPREELGKGTGESRQNPLLGPVFTWPLLLHWFLEFLQSCFGP
jgi:hypothetical protein